MYWLAPSNMNSEQNFATWENGFSESEITNIISLGNGRQKSSATIGYGDKGTTDETIRKSQVSWLDQADDTGWLYDKVGWIIRQLNGKFFNFDLTGFAEAFQYTTYSSDGGHYDWHIDKGNLGNIPRKLSITIQLSSPDEYEGGDFVIKTGSQEQIMEKTKGLAIAFPSWILHRVTPVTAGTRRSLVIWTGGPSWR